MVSLTFACGKVGELETSDAQLVIKNEQPKTHKKKRTTINEQPTTNNELTIDGPANIRNRIKGEKIDQLPNEFQVQLLGIEGNWAKIEYYLDKQKKEGWTHLQNLPHPGILIGPTHDLEKRSSLLEIDLAKEEVVDIESSYNLTFIANSKAPRRVKELMYTQVFPLDNYKSIQYALIYTGLIEFPYLLYYSGQMGELAASQGQLILFHPDKTERYELEINHGNRVISEFITMEDHILTVKEAFYCMIPVNTKIGYSNKGFQRIRGAFEQSAKLPKPGLREADPEAFTRLTHLERDLLLFPNQQENIEEAILISMGTSISLQLLKVDFKKELVKVKVNQHIGWIVMETLRELNLLNDILMTGCGVG